MPAAAMTGWFFTILFFWFAATAATAGAFVAAPAGTFALIRFSAATAGAALTQLVHPAIADEAADERKDADQAEPAQVALMGKDETQQSRTRDHADNPVYCSYVLFHGCLPDDDPAFNVRQGE